MNKNMKNTIIGIIALALIGTGIWMMTGSKSDSDNILDTDNTQVISTSTNASDVSTGANSNGNAQANDGQLRDANGCIISADFVWDIKIGSCVHKTKVSTSTISGGTTITKPSGTTNISNAMAENLCMSKGGTWFEKVRECNGVGQNACESIGGEFNECASACRNDPAAQVCTMQCVQVCSIK